MTAQFTAAQRCLSLLKPELRSIANFVHCLSRFQVLFCNVIQLNSDPNNMTYAWKNRFMTVITEFYKQRKLYFFCVMWIFLQCMSVAKYEFGFVTNFFQRFSKLIKDWSLTNSVDFPQLGPTSGPENRSAWPINHLTWVTENSEEGIRSSGTRKSGTWKIFNVLLLVSSRIWLM
jgi:hypothetical protein